MARELRDEVEYMRACLDMGLVFLVEREVVIIEVDTTVHRLATK